MFRVFQNGLYPLWRYILGGCGWLIVLFEWVHVSHETPGRDEVMLFLVLIPALFLIHTGATAWIRHSKRVAARGKRGLVTRYTFPDFSEDHLGRQLIVDDNLLLNKEVDVSVHGNAKSYTSLTRSLE